MKVGKLISIALFIAYCLFIVWFTLISRHPNGVHEAQLELFWLYRDLIAGKPGVWSTVQQNLSSIVFFFPFGFLFPKREWKLLLISATALSTAIELSQYIFTLGLCEIDDVICNTVGSIIGFIGMKSVRERKNRFSQEGFEDDI